MSTQRADETPTPAWLNAEMIQEALHNGGEPNLRVTGLTTRAATAPGQNYGSAMIRVQAALADGGERSLIVKTLPPGEATASVVLECNVFQKEIAALAGIIPRMESLLEKTSPEGASRLAPRCLHHSCGPDFFIVMEDLAPQGFRSANRHKGLGLRHSLVALRALARFHAASAAVLERDPSAAGDFGNPCNAPDAMFGNFMKWGIQSVMDVCRELPGMETVTRGLKTFQPGAVEAFTKVRDPKPGAFNVLIHGDFWLNNIMFRYENGEPRDVRLVDFQLTQVASATVDLLGFLNTSVSESVSLHHEGLLLREYHKALTEAMQLLGLLPPSLEALLAEMDANGVHGVFAAICCYAPTKSVMDVDIDEAIGGESQSQVDIFRQPVVTRWLQRVLPEYQRRGWFPK